MKTKELEPWMHVAGYLKDNLSTAKKQLGSQCTFLSLIKERKLNTTTGEQESIESFYAIMKNDAGSKDKVIINLDKESYKLDVEDFKELVYTLNSRSYENERESTDTV